MEQTEEEKWIDREDPDSDGTPPTKKIEHSLSSEELIKEIKMDKKCSMFKESSANLISGIFGFLFFSFVGLALTAYAIMDIVQEPATFFENGILIMMSVVVLLLAGGGIYIYKINTLFTSKKGIGHTHHKFADCAIQWEHISHIAIDEKDNDIYMMWIHGNRRKIIFQNPWWSRKRFTYSELKRYLPNLDLWVVSQQKNSRRKVVRYRRNI